MDETRWILAPPRPEAEKLALEMGLPFPIAQVLANRGLSDAEAGRRFLSGTLQDLHDPNLMSGMDSAVERISLAIREGQTILIFGDYDVDGILSVVMLRRALEGLGGRVEYFIPDRLKDGYGIKAGHVAVVLEKGARLVISADCGIRSNDFVQEARAHGVDVIITDHHLPGKELPAAAAILNPVLEGSSYPERSLAGVGVVFKLIQALLARYGSPTSVAHYLKLVALGTISDIAELKGENRIFVRYGLKGLESVTNIGLKSLLAVSGVAGRRVTEGDVGFRIGPRLNAAGRMDKADLAVRLFFTGSAEEAGEIVGRLDELNAQRQRTEERIFKQALEKVEERSLDRRYRVLVLGSEAWHRGVVGIVASKLKDVYHRPVILFAYEDGIAYGSGRSIREFSLIDCLDSCRGHFLNYGGHRLAVGCSLVRENMSPFRASLNAMADERLSEEDLKRKIRLEAKLDLAEIDAAFLETYAQLSPFGVGNPTPLFMSEGVELVSQPQKLQGRHAKFLVRQSGRTLEAIGWERADLADRFGRGSTVKLAFSLQSSTYLGEDRLYLSLEDVQP